jgi:hypothetical protein
LPEGRLEQRRLVANDPEIEDFATHAAEHAEKRVAVAVIDFATAQRRTDRAQFVAGREKSDAQTAVDADLGTTQRGDQTEFRRADQSSGSERRLAGGEVFAGAADILATALPRRDHDAVASGLDDFLHHHHIATDRQRRTGHDAHALTGGHAAGKSLTGQRCPGDAQAGLATARQVGMTQRVTVHRRIVVRRHIDRRDHVTGQHTPQRAAQRQPLVCSQRRQLAANEGARLLDRQRIGIVIAETTETGSETHGSFRGRSGGLSDRRAGSRGTAPIGDCRRSAAGHRHEA